MFKNELGRTIMIYLDDILIATETYDEHVKTLRRIFNKLKNETFWLNKKKTSILPTRLEILGHILSDKGLEAKPEQIQKVLAFPVPKNKKQLQQFTGAINWLSKFCPKLATIAAPLTDLQGSTKAWKWGPTQQASFERCQDLIASNAVIQPINHQNKEPIWLVTDASDIRLGSWIGQGTMDQIRPAEFHSKKFNPAQLNYPTLQKELLAIYES